MLEDDDEVDHRGQGVGSIHSIDLFASAGGLTIDMKAAGLRTACAVELEPYRTQTYATHTPDAEIITSDVRQVLFEKYRGKVELVYGRPPCQPFSSGGLRKSHADERNMIPEFVRAVREIEPEAFVMEYVPGLSRPALASFAEGAAHLVVECDGHEFHEKTKDQAEADKTRDRTLQTVGYPVFRFTGSKLTRDPFACARECLVALVSCATGEDRGETDLLF